MMNYDIAVIGAGPAGMTAAGRAAATGARVILLEKNTRPGIKLLLTGGGRCNLTNVSFPARVMAGQYGRNGRFFISSLTRFDADDAIAFFNDRGVATKVEERGRVFPESDRGREVLDALVGWMKGEGVELRTDAAVSAIIKQNTRIEKLILATGEEVFAGHYVLATGGKSYPGTGSTGDAYRWLESLGHTVVTPIPALCAITTRGPTAGRLQGLSLRDLPLTAFKNDKKIAAATGDVLFTRTGLSGPAVLDLSKAVGKNLPGAVTICLDFFPEKDHAEADALLVELFSKNSNKLLKTVAGMLLPDKLVPIVIALSRIDAGKAANAVTREERGRVVDLLKRFRFEVESVADFDKATVTAGGVSLEEVDSKTMRSKIVENLFLAGEILDLDGPTGGYNLQVCWSTGMAAGEGAGL
jgi:predicted Rossmann fold flavoprotein